MSSEASSEASSEDAEPKPVSTSSELWSYEVADLAR